MNRQELVQQRKMVGWYGEDAESWDDEKIQEVFSGLREKFAALIKEGRARELSPDKAPDQAHQQRLFRTVRAIAGESIRDIARSDNVLPVAVAETVRYSLARLAFLEVGSIESQEHP